MRILVAPTYHFQVLGEKRCSTSSKKASGFLSENLKFRESFFRQNLNCRGEKKTFSVPYVRTRTRSCACSIRCAHYPRNAALSSFDHSAGYRFSNLAPLRNNSDDLFIILTFSGGGTRAMAMSYGVMEKLKETRISRHGSERSLLDEADVISSVSGGR